MNPRRLHRATIFSIVTVSTAPVLPALSAVVSVGAGLRGFCEVFAIPMGILGVRSKT
jgi:hypothetical protein